MKKNITCDRCGAPIRTKLDLGMVIRNGSRDEYYCEQCTQTIKYGEEDEQ